MTELCAKHDFSPRIDSYIVELNDGVLEFLSRSATCEFRANVNKLISQLVLLQHLLPTVSGLREFNLDNLAKVRLALNDSIVNEV